MAVEVQFVLFICHRKGIEINFISLPAFMSKMFILAFMGLRSRGAYQVCQCIALKWTFWHLKALPIQVQGVKMPGAWANTSIWKDLVVYNRTFSVQVPTSVCQSKYVECRTFYIYSTMLHWKKLWIIYIGFFMCAISSIIEKWFDRGRVLISQWMLYFVWPLNFIVVHTQR